jgi:hypothetical protein
MRKTLAFPVIAVVIGWALGCGDEKKKETAGSSNPAECLGGFTGTGNVSGCSESEIEDYSACVESACLSEYENCFGPDYHDGEFSGACAGLLECKSGCECEDQRCQQNCTPSTECTSCLATFVSCGQSCASKLACAMGAGGDAGPGDAGVSGKTCADLLVCCNSLSDTARQQQCTMTHAQLSMFGSDAQCSPVVDNYCP